MNRQWWLAELDQYGNAKLDDGPHSERAGCEQAYYIYKRLGLDHGATFRVAEVILTEVSAIPHNVDEESLNTLNSIGLRP